MLIIIFCFIVCFHLHIFFHFLFSLLFFVLLGGWGGKSQLQARVEAERQLTAATTAAEQGARDREVAVAAREAAVAQGERLQRDLTVRPLCSRLLHVGADRNFSGGLRGSRGLGGPPLLMSFFLQ